MNIIEELKSYLEIKYKYRFNIDNVIEEFLKIVQTKNVKFYKKNNLI